ncbi:haloacid dehalogenase [Jannaschia sp. EhC01]|nr:haloacid dehalogenase [Jannaschia sp. EhC01]
MTQVIEKMSDIADFFDAIVLDQWGVLHDGTTPYPGAIKALCGLNKRLAVLSNSGKRAGPNAARITGMGFPERLFECVMTSGEALWQDIATGRIAHRILCPITRGPGDAETWAKGLDVMLTPDVAAADAILLMGLPDRDAHAAEQILAAARARDVPVLCTNPDRASPRAGGQTVVSPGALAHAYAEGGGQVQFYGKPHGPVFAAVAASLDVAPERLLMVGDSLEHDIAGGQAAGWSTLFIRGGLHASAFTQGADIVQTIARLAQAEDAPMPTYTLDQLG